MLVQRGKRFAGITYLYLSSCLLPAAQCLTVRPDATRWDHQYIFILYLFEAYELRQQNDPLTAKLFNLTFHSLEVMSR